MDKKQALELAIKSLDFICRTRFSVSASAARYGFDFGLKAEAHRQEYTQAIQILDQMIQELNQETASPPR